MRIELHNLLNGQTVACDEVKPLVKVVRNWVYYGMTNNTFRVHIAPKNVRYYLRELVDAQTLDKCDVCLDSEVKKKDMHYHVDNHGVTMFAECKDCYKG